MGEILTQSSNTAEDAIELILKSILRSAEVSRLMQLPDGQSIAVVDGDKLRRLLQDQFEGRVSTNEEKAGRVLRAIARVFNQPVLTERQLASDDLRPKPLLYVPQNVDKATNVTEIKKATFQFGLWDLFDKIKQRAAQPVVSEKKNDRISILETRAALLIFHPKFGDGFRDERGTLYVRDPSTREYTKFSAKFLGKHGIHQNYFKYDENQSLHRPGSSRTTRAGIESELPHLVAKKLVQPFRDFKQVTLGSGKRNERAVERAGVSSSGSRMLRGVLHYIGKEFYGKPVRIVEVSPSLGAVVDESAGVPKITHLFKIFSREEITPTDKGYYVANAAETNCEPFSAATMGINRFPDESQLKYQDRLKAVDHGIAHLLLTVAPKKPEIAELFKMNSPTLLAEVGKTAFWLSRAENAAVFDDFINTYGRSGLRTFLASAYDQSVSQNILTFASGEKRFVEDIFQQYSRMINAAETIAEHLGKSEMFKSDLSHVFAQQLFQIAVRRAGHLFSAGAQMQTGEYVGTETLRDLSVAFEGIATAFTVIAKGLREARDGRFLSTEAFRLDVEHGGIVYECKILIRPEDTEGKKSGKEGVSRLPARISFEVKLPENHPLHEYFIPGYQLSESARSVEGKEAARAERRLNQSTIRIAFDLDEEDGKRICSADFARGDNVLGDRGTRSGDVLGRILDKVAPEGHRLTEGLDPRLSDPVQFAVPARALKGLLKEYVERLISERKK